MSLVTIVNAAREVSITPRKLVTGRVMGYLDVVVWRSRGVVFWRVVTCEGEEMAQGQEETCQLLPSSTSK